MTVNLIRLAAIIGLLALLSACSSTSSGEKSGYQQQVQAEENLEIPPDLTSSSIQDAMKVPDKASESSATYSDYAYDRQGQGEGRKRVVTAGVLPVIDGIQVRRDGNQRWLEIDAPAEEVWYQVLEFWRDSGLLLVEQDPAIGIMKTDWLEDRADIKQEVITESHRKTLDSLYSAGTRDQFRVRLESDEHAGVTNLFLTHRGMEEKLRGETTFWVSRPPDPELEAEMLYRLMVFMGVDDARATHQLVQEESRQARSQLIKGEERVELLIHEPFVRAWRLTGVALDRVGFAVEDRNRSEGIYFVRYDDPDKEMDEQGWFSKLFSSDDEVDIENRYQVRLTDQDGETRVQIFNHEEQRDNSSTAVRILSLIHEQIK